jgi:DNA-binding Lrp family transcriptional regulator
MPKQTRAEYLKSFEDKRKRIKKMLAASLSYSEIARALGVSPEAVRRMVERMEAKQ